MSYLLVESFSQGLDTRRGSLSSKPGTLQRCNNAHITRGGEIEKRKAFIPAYLLPVGQTFGMVSAKGNLYTFGSVDSASFVTPMPQGVTYQRLQHKAGNSPMTALLHADTFNGKIYAVAQFQDGSIFHYYNGVRVPAWDSIAALAGDNDGVAAAFADQINLMAEFNASSAGSVVTITSVVNNKPFTPTRSTIDGGSYTYNVVGTQLVWDGTYLTDLGTGALNKHYVTQNVYAYVYHPLNDQTITLVKSQAASVSQPEIWTATIGGTFQPLDSFSIRIVNADGFDQTFNVQGAAAGSAQFVKTMKGKEYAITRSLLYFSEINSPQIFNTNVNGSGFINMSNQDGGSEDLTALGNYQGKLAVFSRNNIQIWAVDPDPLKYIQLQVLNHIGTSSPKSVTSFGDVDLFFLADSGIRSVKARDASNSAAVSDVGVYIDDLIAAALRNETEIDVRNAVGIVEPKEGRYMLAIGGTIYVYSFFPTPSISAWSTYTPGFTVSDFAYASNRVHARSGDIIYAYGGLDGTEYDDCEVDVVLPYLDAGKPAHAKQFTGVDGAFDGAWTIWGNFDSAKQDAYDRIADVVGPTYDQARMSAIGQGTHIGIKLHHKDFGYARISNIAIHYEGGEEDKS